MADFFSKVKKGLNKGTTVIGVKSSTMIETNKIKSEISSLKKEKNEIFTAIGEKIYNMRKEGNVDLAVIDPTLNRAFEIDHTILERENDIEELIKKQEETLQALEEENHEDVDGTQYNTTSPEEIVICECGAELTAGTMFCAQCGRKVSE